MIKCFGCQNEIKLEHKSLRYQSKWYYQKCIEIPKKESFETKNTIPRKIKKKIDSIQFILAGLNIVFLVAAVFFLLGPISMFAMVIGGEITCYHMIGTTGKLFSKNKYSKKRPSSFLLFLLGSPFLIALIIAYERYLLSESLVRIILLWAMTVTLQDYLGHSHTRCS